ncbi:unnamed protein product [Camellia sinensis]
MQLPFIIILVCCFTNLLAFAQAGNETDRLALLDFKSKVTDDPLGILTSWNESIHFCHWHGVTCSADRVTMLDLQSQNLVGSISPHIGNLSFLTVLQLYNNSFTDEIPPEIGNLQRLQILRLHNNSITRQIPVNISACSSLVRINFAINMLVGNIPVQLGLLSILQALYLDKNNFTGGIPSSLGNLSSFNDLSASYNNLGGAIPETLGHLTYLTFIGLGYNNLSNTIPASIFNLTNLKEFHASYNNIQGSLPQDFGIYLPKLQTLAIRFNRLSGPIPVSITNASSLLNIMISVNNFSGKLPTLEGLPKLHHIIMSLNDLGTGEADDSDFLSSLINATELEEVSMDGNNLGGMLPNSISNFSTRLLRLSLANNRMFGSIPTVLLTVCSSVDYEGNEFKALVYKFVSNGNLDEWLHVNAWDVEANVEPMKKLNLLQRLNIAIDVACAVDFLHHGCQTPVVHCDLKPSNVLLDDEMTAHVGDFGLARSAIQGTSNLFGNEGTSSIGIRGSIGYVAPEYGMGCEVSTYGDVYSYGILLLEMFTGKKPTHEMFKDSLSLHKFAKMATPKTVEEIADPILLEQEGETSTNTDDTQSQNHVSRETIA